MKTYRVSRAGRWRVEVVLVVLALIFLYSSRKALGLWGGASAKPSDPHLLGLNLNTTLPAFFLSLVALGCLGVAWYLVIELLSEVRVDPSGILVNAPGYRLFYRWNEVVSIDVLSGPEEDTAACLRIAMAAPEGAALVEEAPAEQEPVETDQIAVYLSEADLRGDRTVRQRLREVRRQQAAQIRAHVTRPDGRALPLWMRLLYPQARYPDRLLLYPSLEDRPALIAEIEQHLAQV